MFIHETDQPTVGGNTTQRKKYRKPKLEVLGDLRSLTLGGSPGVNDTGNPFVTQPQMNMPQRDGFPPFEGF